MMKNKSVEGVKRGKSKGPRVRNTLRVDLTYVCGWNTAARRWDRTERKKREGTRAVQVNRLIGRAARGVVQGKEKGKEAGHSKVK